MVQTKSGYKASGEPLTILQQHRRPPYAKETTSTMTNIDDQLLGQDDLATKETPLKETYKFSSYNDEDEDDYEDEDDDNKSKNLNKTIKHGSHHPFKVEARIDIPTYDGTIDAEKLDSWIDQLETYFTLYGFSSSDKVVYAWLKLTSHALAWWNSQLKTREDDVSWKEFTRLLRQELYPMSNNMETQVKEQRKFRFAITNQYVDDVLSEVVPLDIFQVINKLDQVIANYRSLFEDKIGLPPNRVIEHEIQLVVDSNLPNIVMYRNSLLDNTEIKRQVEELIMAGVIKPSSSPCGSTIILVPKKDGGHHQVWIREDDTWKTTFKTRQGLYEWLAMSFRLCNAPATFIRLMNDILRPHINDFVVVYLDDILIYSQTEEEHLEHLPKSSTYYSDMNFVYTKKCEFEKRELVYLGFVVGDALFHALTKMNSKFEWTKKHDDTFLLLKRKISEAPVLALPNFATTIRARDRGAHGSSTTAISTKSSQVTAGKANEVDDLLAAVQPPCHDDYASEYKNDLDFHRAMKDVKCSNSTEFTWQGNLFYKGVFLCIPKIGDQVRWLREAHTSKVARHFGVTKTLQNLQRYVFWPRMHQDVAQFMKGCVLCSTSKPTNRKVGLYTPLSVPNRPWESISMDFVGGLPRTRKGNDYFFVVVDRFSKMVVLMLCKKTITGEEPARLFFEINFWCSLWAKTDTKLTRSTSFHPQTDGQTEVVNRTVVYLLIGYNARHQKTWDESIPFLQFEINHTVRSSTNKAPSEVCLGFLPQSPFDMEFTINSTPRNDRKVKEEVKVQRFIENIRKIHQELEGPLHRSQQTYKERHGRHRIQGNFQEENACKLELPAYMELYSVVNVDKLMVFEPSMLDDESRESLPSVDALVTGKEIVLTKDTIVERKTSSTKREERQSFRIGIKGQHPSATKWFSKEVSATRFPHLEF
nr:hypothetical protein [Tanacetum cinerariifolium]